MLKVARRLLLSDPPLNRELTHQIYEWLRFRTNDYINARRSRSRIAPFVCNKAGRLCAMHVQRWSSCRPFLSHTLASALFKSSVQHPRTPLRKLLRPRSRRTPNLSPLSHRAHRPRRRRLRRRQIRRGRRAGGPDTLRRGGAKRPEHQSRASTAGRKPGPGGTEPFERPGPARLLGDGRLPRGPEVPHPQG